MKSIENLVSKIEDRKQSVVKLLPKETCHKAIELSIQSVYGSLGAAAELLPEIVAAAQKYSEDQQQKMAKHKEDSAKERKILDERLSRLAETSTTTAMKDWASAFERQTTEMSAANETLIQFQINFSAVAVGAGLFSLLKSAEALGSSRDEEALQHLGLRVAEGAVKWGTKLLPIRYEDLQDILNVIQAIKEMDSLGELKLRTQQARSGSDFLTWIEAVRLLAYGWCAEAQRFLLATTGQGNATDDEILRLVEPRVLKSSFAGWPD